MIVNQIVPLYETNTNDNMNLSIIWKEDEDGFSIPSIRYNEKIKHLEDEAIHILDMDLKRDDIVRKRIKTFFEPKHKRNAYHKEHGYVILDKDNNV